MLLPDPHDLVYVKHTGRAEPLFVLRLDFLQTRFRLGARRVDDDENSGARQRSCEVRGFSKCVDEGDPIRKAALNDGGQKLLPCLFADRLSCAEIGAE